MVSSTNNGTLGTPFGWQDEQSGHYTPMPRQRNAPTVSNLPYNDLHGTGESYQESHMVSDFSPNMNSWFDNGFSDLSFPMHGGGVWLGDNEACLVPLFGGVPEDVVPGSQGNFFTDMQIAAPLAEQANPVVPSILPTSESFPPPSVTWTQLPGLPSQSTSPVHHPVNTAGQYSNPNSSPGMRPEFTSFQLTASSAITGHLKRSPRQSCLVPRDLVLVSSSAHRSHGERWDRPSATTFQCLWSSHGTQCSALIAGNRRSVTSHLRDEHHFTCDGQMVSCAWAGCAAWMQRRNIPRHIIACHLAIKVPCAGCGLALSRADATKKHQLACTGVRTPAVMEATEEDEGGYF